MFVKHICYWVCVQINIFPWNNCSIFANLVFMLSLQLLGIMESPLLCVCVCVCLEKEVSVYMENVLYGYIATQLHVCVYMHDLRRDIQIIHMRITQQCRGATAAINNVDEPLTIHLNYQTKICKQKEFKLYISIYITIKKYKINL